MKTLSSCFTEQLGIFLKLNFLFRLMPDCFYSSPRLLRTKGVGLEVPQPSIVVL